MNKMPQIFRDCMLGGILVFCVLTFWKTAAFVTMVNMFMESQRIEHIKLDVRLSTLAGDIQILKEWKVAKTQRPFAYGQSQQSNTGNP